MNRITRRRLAFHLAGLGLALAAAFPALADDADQPLRSGKVFTSTNGPAGNELLVYGNAPGGALALVARAATDGLGTGASLASQGAVTLSGDGRHVFVVNAGSNTVSTFTLRGNEMTLTSVVDSLGLQPTSVTEHHGLVYVLNAGGAGNVAGFRLAGDALQPLADAARGLSAAGGTAPAQVGFGSSGNVLLVTEKGTSQLTSYPVRADGSLGQAIVTASSGQVPYGFAFDRRDHAIVSEAVMSAASSYRFDARGSAVPRLVSGSVPNTQAAACWVAVSPDGRHAFTANAGTSTISSYAIDPAGGLTLAHAVAGGTGAGAGVTDMAVTPAGRQLFALTPRSHQIVAFTIGDDGSLDMRGAGSVPAGSVGLAAN